MVNEIEVRALPENLQDVLDFVDEQLEAMGAPRKLHLQMEVATEEIFVNIAHYAYAPDTGMAIIRAETDCDNQQISISFMDEGKPFDPLAKPDPDVTLSSSDREIGGLGIYMVKKRMDDMQYEYRNGKNILTITKGF